MKAIFTGTEQDLIECGFEYPFNAKWWQDDYMFKDFYKCRNKTYLIEHKNKELYVIEYLKPMYVLRTIKSKRILQEVLYSIFDKNLVRWKK